MRVVALITQCRIGGSIAQRNDIPTGVAERGDILQFSSQLAIDMASGIGHIADASHA